MSKETKDVVSYVTNLCLVGNIITCLNASFFVLFCFFKESRKQYLPVYCLRHYDTYRSAKLMTSISVKILNRLSEFIAMVLRFFLIFVN